MIDNEFISLVIEQSCKTISLIEKIFNAVYNELFNNTEESDDAGTSD